MQIDVAVSGPCTGLFPCSGSWISNFQRGKKKGKMRFRGEKIHNLVFFVLTHSKAGWAMGVQGKVIVENYGRGITEEQWRD